MYRNKVYILILATTLLRLMIANSIELGNDEVYYWTYSLHLQWSYFDHPPLVAILIRITTFNLFLQQEMYLRLGGIIGAAIGTWLSYSIGKKIKNERTGWFAAILYNTSIYCSIVAGVFILPDSPQVVFWLLSLRVALNFTDNRKPTAGTWVLWGFFTGLCIMCKVHGLFLWMGLGFYILVYRRNLLADRYLYLSMLITIFLISPIFLWNWENNFITLHYHGSRISVSVTSINKNSFILATIGQIVYNNPFNVLLIFHAIGYYTKKKTLLLPARKILLLFGLPIVVIVTALSMFNTVLPHWSGPGFLTLQFLAASYLDSKCNESFIIPPVLKYASGFALSVILVVLTLVAYFPGTLGSKDQNSLGASDFTLDLYGWREGGKAFGEWVKKANLKSELPFNNIIVCNKWFPAAHIDYYFARPNKMQVIGVGTLNNLHHYAWLNLSRNDLKRGDSAICIIPSNMGINPSTTYLNYFISAKLIYELPSKRMYTTARYFKIYLLKGYLANDEAHEIISVRDSKNY